MACYSPSQDCVGLHCGLLDSNALLRPSPQPWSPASPAKANHLVVPQTGSTAPAVASTECLAHLSFLQDLPNPDALSQGGWLTGGGENQPQPPPPVCWGHKASADRIQGRLWQGVQGAKACAASTTLRVNLEAPMSLHIHTSTPACPRTSLQAGVCSRT